MTSWPSKSTLQSLLDLAGLHYTTSERSCPFWQSMLHSHAGSPRPLSFLVVPLHSESFVEILLCLMEVQPEEHCNSPVQCSSGWTSIKHNKISTNDSECSGTTGLQRAHVTPLFISLHCILVAVRIEFKTLILAYRTTTGSASTYFYSLLRICIPSRSLRSASERRLVVPSQRSSKSLSRTFSFTILGWWSWSSHPIRMLPTPS